MIITSYRPDFSHRGLYATYYTEIGYMNTSFNLVLDEENKPVENEILRTCAKLFSFLISNDPDRDPDDYCAGSNRLHFSFFHCFGNDGAREWAVGLCRRFLDRESLDKAFIAGLPLYDKATEYVSAFLTDVAENGKYEYRVERS